MKFNPDIHHRKSLRLKDYDYSQSGAYFVTICTRDRGCLFGEVMEGKMRVNEFGRIIEQEWNRTAVVRDNVALDEFIVMPNHFHGILVITGRRGMAVTCPGLTLNRAIQLSLDLNQFQNGHEIPETMQALSAREGMSPPCPYNQFGHPVSGSLGSIVGHFKSITTKRINIIRAMKGTPIWQRNYHEHIIRNDDEFNRIREYIQNNPLQWALDENNPINFKNNLPFVGATGGSPSREVSS